MIGRSEAGATLIELMAGLAVATVVVAAAFTSLTGSNKAARINDQTAETQQNVRIAMGVLARDLQAAGYGMTGPVGQCESAVVPADNNPAGPDHGPDRLSLVVPLTGTAPAWTLSQAAPAGTPTQLTLQAGAGQAMGLATGGVVPFAISIGGVLSATVTNIAGDALTLNAPIGAPVTFPIGTQVHILQCITYQVIAPGDPNVAACGGNAPCLVRGTTSNLATPRDCNALPNTCVAIAEGIEDLQVAYGCDGCNAAVNGGVEDRIIDDQDGVVGFTDGDFVSNSVWAAAPMTANTIRVVRVGVVGRQVQRDQGLGDGRNPALGVLAPVMVDPDHDPQTGVFAAGDFDVSTYMQLRRRTLTRTVKLRNLG